MKELVMSHGITHMILKELSGEQKKTTRHHQTKFGSTCGNDSGGPLSSYTKHVYVLSLVISLWRILINCNQLDCFKQASEQGELESDWLSPPEYPLSFCPSESGCIHVSKCWLSSSFHFPIFGIMCMKQDLFIFHLSIQVS